MERAIAVVGDIPALFDAFAASRAIDAVRIDLRRDDSGFIVGERGQYLGVIIGYRRRATTVPAKKAAEHDRLFEGAVGHALARLRTGGVVFVICQDADGTSRLKQLRRDAEYLAEESVKWCTAEHSIDVTAIAIAGVGNDQMTLSNRILEYLDMPLGLGEVTSVDGDELGASSIRNLAQEQFL